MSNPWTPGPWEQRALMVTAKGGCDRITHCGGMLHPIPQRVAEAVANARLISKAPEMAALLAEWMEAVSGELHIIRAESFHTDAEKLEELDARTRVLLAHLQDGE